MGSTRTARCQNRSRGLALAGIAPYGIDMNPHVRDLTGQTFSYLAVVRRNGSDKQGTAMWLVRCVCGVEKTVRRSSLTTGDIKSCGCQNALAHTSHGHTVGRNRTPVYRAWESMIYRCTKPNSPAYVDYGGRGICVCERWLQSFEAFLEDMGPKPSSQFSLDRIDNNGHYEPGNCHWATRTTQMRNTRKNHSISIDKTTRTLAEWAELNNLKWHTVSNRLKLGWSYKDAVSLAPNGRLRYRLRSV